MLNANAKLHLPGKMMVVGSVVNERDDMKTVVEKLKHHMTTPNSPLTTTQPNICLLQNYLLTVLTPRK